MLIDSSSIRFWVMQTILLVTVFVCLGGSAIFPSSGLAQTVNKVTISGKVISQTDGKPLRNVNVFIASTMLGSATNDSGHFVIKNVPPGSHELVVSIVGYEPMKIDIRVARSKDKEYTIRLTPQIVAVPEITVVAAREKHWKKRLKRFQTFFLGTSRNAAKCVIINPEVLEFKVDKATGHFRAQANDILHIENRSLGYGLFYLLATFDLGTEMVRYRGKTKFEELTPKSEKEHRRWQKNRLKTYFGSLRHFLAALTARQVEQEGFLVYRMPEMTAEIYASDLQEVNLSHLFSDGELSFERKLHFFDYLQVIYTREPEDREYIYWRLNYDKSAIGMTTQKRLESIRPQAQTSWIGMNKTFATIDTTGYIYDPLALTVYGYWAWESVADLLPFEYVPR